MDQIYSVAASRDVSGMYRAHYDEHVWDAIEAFCTASISDHGSGAYAPRALRKIIRIESNAKNWGSIDARGDIDLDRLCDMVGAANYHALVQNRTEDGEVITPTPQRIELAGADDQIAIWYGAGRSRVCLTVPAWGKPVTDLTLGVSTDDADVLAHLDDADAMDEVWQRIWPKRVGPLFELAKPGWWRITYHDLECPLDWTGFD